MRLATAGRWMAVLAFSLSFGLGHAQEPSQAPAGIPPESDYMYRKHYAEVQQILKAPLAEREAKLDHYMKALHPKSKILKYMVGFYGQIVKDYQAAGQAAKANALLSKMAEMFPEAAAAKEGQDFQRAFQSKNYARAIRLGEKIYARKPDRQVAAMLAQSYIATGNPKAVQFSKKVLSDLGVKQGVYYAAWLAEYYRAQGDQANALKYYNQILKTFASAAPAGWSAQGWRDLLAKAYALRASAAYQQEKFEAAIRSYQTSLQYSPHNAAAYLFLGLSQWKQQKLDLAIDAFAKATVLNQPSSAKAKQYLEQLFKARNQNSLKGLQDLLAAARQALGI